jgi:hypothetical protein
MDANMGFCIVAEPMTVATAREAALPERVAFVFQLHLWWVIERLTIPPVSMLTVADGPTVASAQDRMVTWNRQRQT